MSAGVQEWVSCCRFEKDTPGRGVNRRGQAWMVCALGG
jgi:hypothetical protein